MELAYVVLFHMEERGLETVQESQVQNYLRLSQHGVQLILLVIPEEQVVGVGKGYNDLY